MSGFSRPRRNSKTLGRPCFRPVFFLFGWVSVVGFHLTENRSQFIRIVDQAKYEVLQRWYCHIVARSIPRFKVKPQICKSCRVDNQSWNWQLAHQQGFPLRPQGSFLPLARQTRHRRCRCHWQPRWIGRSLNVFHSWQLCWIGAPQLRAYLKGPVGQVLQQAIVHSFT